MEASLKETIGSPIEDVQQPFPGLQSYDEKNKSQFGGRDAEINQLFDMVEENGLTIIFGKSGIGKTSLIKAGLIPKLQNNLYYPIYIRIDYSSDKSPQQQLKELITLQLKEADKKILDIGDQNLWVYLHEVKLVDGMITPVIIFDQFEEIFTLGNHWGSKVFENFATELSNLAENYVPLAVQQAFEQRSEMLPLYYSQQPYHIIISLREDYLAQFESLNKYIPSMKDSRFRVMQMTVAQAIDAVIKPAKGLVDAAVAIEIIKKLPGITYQDLDTTDPKNGMEKRQVIEPFLLSLICYQLNEQRNIQQLKVITSQLVEQFDIADVIHSYYEETMSKFSATTETGIEDTLLTESGYRKLEALEELLFKYDIHSDDIIRLIDKRIIRKEIRDGVEYVELIHDVLVPVIRKKRDNRIKAVREQEKQEAVKNALQKYIDRRRKYITTALLVFLPIIAVIGYYTVINARSVKRYEHLDEAKRLVIAAKSISISKGEYEVGALYSRVAYKMFTENRGSDNVEFYMSMYERLTDLDYNFLLTNGDSTTVRSIVKANDTVFFFGCESGKVFKGIASGEAVPLLDLQKKITSMALSTSRRYLAVAGTFDYVCVFDCTKDHIDTIQLGTGKLGVNGKSVGFTDDGRLVLRLDSTLYCWNSETWQPVANSKTQIEKDLNRNNTHAYERKSGGVYYQYGSGTRFNCIALKHNDIVVGIDSGFILLKGDSAIKVNNAYLNVPSSIKFDPTGNFIYIGNDEGKLCRADLINFKINWNQYHTARITDIGFSTKGDFMATSSVDGTIGIWRYKFNWDSLSPLVVPPLVRGKSVYCVSFNEQFVFTGYRSGEIIKWPVQPDFLAELICEKTKGTKLDTALWRKYTGKGISLEDLTRYSCRNNP